MSKNLAVRAAQPRSRGSLAEIEVAGTWLVPDCEGALLWPDEGLLVLADLHLEKGSSFAARGVLLPPYDTAATLTRLARLIGRHAPRAVVALGDSFHDNDGGARLSAADRALLVSLQRGRDWIWITGNHDPDPLGAVGGSYAESLAIGTLTFHHQPTGTAGEIAGHLHPVARMAGRGRTLRRRCFAGDGSRLVMPAFGAYAGGLNIRDRAFAAVFGGHPFTVHMLGEARLYAFVASRCLPD